MQGRIVIVAYIPHPGREAELAELVRGHVPFLREHGLATEREPVIGRTEDGTLIEVFEWTSKQAIEKAHEMPEVQELWKRFAEVGRYEPIAEVPEAHELFSEFAAVS